MMKKKSIPMKTTFVEKKDDIDDVVLFNYYMLTLEIYSF